MINHTASPTPGAQRVHAPAPLTPLSQSLLDVLAARRSERVFSPQPLTQELLETLLWAAAGVNRPELDMRTAPSAKNWREIDIYATTEDGWYRFAPAAGALQLLGRQDLRAATGWQDFVAAAPVNLVYVADLARMDHAPKWEQKFYAALDTGYISQNVYLFCAAQGLATVARGWVDRPALARVMGLAPQQRVILAQTVGYPGTADAAPADGAGI
ncbi:SagB/ThcOx family dehydrogenase [Duganella hordei]|uniref:SagB/ThcOx family dehydrogenase n=1 Tax=Duganella hordei TaxID=2865934 RepID=UPI0030E804E9